MRPHCDHPAALAQLQQTTWTTARAVKLPPVLQPQPKPSRTYPSLSGPIRAYPDLSEPKNFSRLPKLHPKGLAHRNPDRFCKTSLAGPLAGWVAHSCCEISFRNPCLSEEVFILSNSEGLCPGPERRLHIPRNRTQFAHLHLSTPKRGHHGTVKLRFP